MLSTIGKCFQFQVQYICCKEYQDIQLNHIGNFYSYLLNTYRQLKKFDEAQKNYNECLKLKSDYADAYNNLGLLYQDLFEFDKDRKSTRLNSSH